MNRQLRQLIRAWIIAFYADTLSYTVTLTFDLLTLYCYSTSGVMRLNSVHLPPTILSEN